MSTPPREKTLAWAYDGAAHLRALMARMGEDAFAAPSTLPGWSRAHLLTHIARNADAMVNLLEWARTGTVTPAYPSPEHRAADIEAGARRPPVEIREDVLESGDRLAVVVRGMPEQAWSVSVTHADGSEILAASVPWYRAREMWIHAVDLDVGASFEDMPVPMLLALVHEMTRRLAGREGCPSLQLVASDVERTWALSPGQPAESVTGPLAGLAAWLTGRSKGRELRTSAGRRPPAIPAGR